MEPIRPDDDEVRSGTETTPRAAAPADRGVRASAPPETDRQPSAKAGSSRPASGGAGRLVGLLCLLLIAAVVAGAGVAWQQSKRLAAMEAQVEEADYWARQSKLALARFQGELSETGETLAESGSTTQQRLADQEKQIATANSEIRKLWAIANERNRQQLEAQATQLTAHTKQLESLAIQVGGHAESLKLLDNFKETSQQRMAELAGSMSEVQENIVQLTSQDKSLAGDVAAMQSDIQAAVDQRLTRFEREQKLTISGIESRLGALENGEGVLAQTQSQLKKAETRLANLEDVVQSIDSSRAQLTSRLVRLTDQVDALRKR
ncbi:hypothetical protein [Marinobacter caseinilyticus]|uniref:hypothetical protein n=1 Tax=Marinobacter caseinilyticus TaxID=2692195 RepID=UPI00140D94A6|nr:hypothetical protein [Marinobacter caseinilyticus]